jgi:hypothetical protein
VDLSHLIMTGVVAKRAVEILEAAGRQHQTAVRSVGYAVLIQAIGWDGVAEHMPPKALAGLRVAFDDARVSPAEIEFPRRLGNYSRPPK